MREAARTIPVTAFAKANRPCVERSAAVGVTKVKSIFFTLFLNLSRRDDLRLSNDLEQARDWLVADA